MARVTGSMVSNGVFVGVVVVVAVALGLVGYYAGTMLSGSATPSIDPFLGFVGATPTVSPPKQPAHEVNLLIRPRQGIPIPEFYFEPAGLFIRPGDTVKFSFPTPEHSITAYHPALGFGQRVPDGVPPFSSPVLPVGAYWLYTFQREGVYDLFCGPHQILGMVVRIVVGSATGPGASPVPPFSLEEPAPGQLFAPVLTANLVLSDPALSPQNIIAKGRVSWDDLNPQSKIPLIQPVLPP